MCGYVRPSVPEGRINFQKKVKEMKKTVSILLCALLMFCAVTPVLSAFAADSVTVSVVFSDGGTIRMFKNLAVTDGTAEKYGYEVTDVDHSGAAVETATVMDAIVSAHAAAYGGAYSAETKDNYFFVSGGYATSAFQKSSMLGFMVNDIQPNDGILVTSGWGNYYTGYAIDEARIQDGDVITLFTYADTETWMDYYAKFAQKEMEVNSEESFTISASGYSIGWYGSSEQSTIDAATVPMEDAEICWTQDFTSYTTAGTLDENGELTVTAPAEAGTWYLVVRGESNDTPVIANYCTVTVADSANEPGEATDAEWFPTAFRTVFTWNKKILTIGVRFKLHDLKENAEDIDCIFALQFCFDGSQDFFTLIKGE